jgi:hypothetical protein
VDREFEELAAESGARESASDTTMYLSSKEKIIDVRVEWLLKKNESLLKNKGR